MPKLRVAEQPVRDPYEARTIWTMRRHDRLAECALQAFPGCWEVRVALDAEPFYSGEARALTICS